MLDVMMRPIGPNLVMGAGRTNGSCRHDGGGFRGARDDSGGGDRCRGRIVLRCRRHRGGGGLDLGCTGCRRRLDGSDGKLGHFARLQFASADRVKTAAEDLVLDPSARVVPRCGPVVVGARLVALAVLADGVGLVDWTELAASEDDAPRFGNTASTADFVPREPTATPVGDEAAVWLLAAAAAFRVGGVGRVDVVAARHRRHAGARSGLARRASWPKLAATHATRLAK